MSSSFCTECGSKLPFLAKFCAKCGASVGGVGKTTTPQKDTPTTPKPRIRLASDYRNKNVSSEDEDYEDQDGEDIDSVPVISKLDITISQDGRLEGTSDSRYGSRKFRASDIFDNL